MKKNYVRNWNRKYKKIQFFKYNIGFKAKNSFQLSNLQWLLILAKIKKILKRKNLGKIFIWIPLGIQDWVSSKPKLTRMGKGKGELYLNKISFKINSILIEFSGNPKIFWKLKDFKLPIKLPIKILIKNNSFIYKII